MINFLIYFQTQDIDHVTYRLKIEILPQIDKARKLKNWILSDGDRKVEFLSKLNHIFDIAKCRCFKNKDKLEDFIYSDCKCPAENKLLNFDGYKVFMTDKTARILITEDEKIGFEKILSGKIHLLLFRSPQIERSLHLLSL